MCTNIAIFTLTYAESGVSHPPCCRLFLEVPSNLSLCHKLRGVFQICSRSFASPAFGTTRAKMRSASVELKFRSSHLKSAIPTDVTKVTGFDLLRASKGMPLKYTWFANRTCSSHGHGICDGRKDQEKPTKWEVNQKSDRQMVTVVIMKGSREPNACGEKSWNEVPWSMV